MLVDSKKDQNGDPEVIVVSQSSASSSGPPPSSEGLMSPPGTVSALGGMNSSPGLVGNSGLPSPGNNPQPCSTVVSLHSQEYGTGGHPLPDATDTKESIEELCPVCGDKVSGYHYGLLTCESCKGFFKRTVQNKKVYTCVSDRSCHIDKSQRKRCPYCRFQKCLDVGMKLEAVRADRMRGGRNKFGPMYKRDRARRLQIMRQKAIMGRGHCPSNGDLCDQLGMHHTGNNNAVAAACSPPFSMQSGMVNPTFYGLSESGGHGGVKQELIQIPQLSSSTSSPGSSPSPLTGSGGNGALVPHVLGGHYGSGMTSDAVGGALQALGGANSGEDRMSGNGESPLNNNTNNKGCWGPPNVTPSSSPLNHPPCSPGAPNGGTNSPKGYLHQVSAHHPLQQGTLPLPPATNEGQSSAGVANHASGTSSTTATTNGSGVMALSGGPLKIPVLLREFQLSIMDEKEWQSSLFGLLQNQTYNQCEVDLFELMCKVIDQSLFGQVDWARNSIFFKDLKVDDQMKLLQHSWSDMLILDHLHQRIHHGLPDETTLVNGQKFDLLALALLGQPGLADNLHRIAAKFQELKFDPIDYICLKFLLLLNPVEEVRGLSNTKLVHEAHEQAQQTLLEYTISCYPQITDKFGLLLQILPEIHVIGMRGEEYLYFRHLSGSAPTQTLLMEMLHAKKK